MDIESFREYCLSKPGVTEEFPFDEETLVFKVMGKMFALSGLNEDFRISLKCYPDKALELREHYPSVIPAYHMNKMHWNTVIIDGTVNDSELFSWIDLSYQLVSSKLPAKLKIKLNQMK